MLTPVTLNLLSSLQDTGGVVISAPVEICREADLARSSASLALESGAGAEKNRQA
jgi:hypothetical protein